MNEVKTHITAGVMPVPVVGRFERRLAAADFRLPPGYHLAGGGETAKRNEAVDNLLADVAVLVALSVASLVNSCRSFHAGTLSAVVGQACRADRPCRHNTSDRNAAGAAVIHSDGRP